MPDKIRITYEELKDPRVDEVLARQTEESAWRAGAPAVAAGPAKTGFIHRNWFYLMMAGLIGAFIAWSIVEPFFKDEDIINNKQAGIAFLMLISVGGMAGLMIGAAEGILARNYSRAARSGLIGLGIGVGGGLASAIIAGLVMMLVALVGVAIVGEQAASDPAHHFSGFLLLMIWRSIAWTLLFMAVGLGPGIALKSKKMAMNGFVGGMIGGAIGGLLFDPIFFLISGGSLAKEADLSRAVGFTLVGAFAGLMIGLVETLAKEAWLLMTAGPLKGKQFIIYRNPTLIGSSPRCDVYLFKDPEVEEAHAAINLVRDGYELEDKGTKSGTYVNNVRIKRKRLVNGDQIRIGSALFVYSEKEKKEKKGKTAKA
ncbi:MAG TPA: FHA domain-containing protein [Acidobacteriota bacterium]